MYHNAISSGVEVQDILKHARTSKETTHVVADEVSQLRKQVDAQQLLIRQLMERSGGPASSTHAAVIGGGGGSSKRNSAFASNAGDTELTSLMLKSPEPTYVFKSAAAPAAIPSYGSTSAVAPPALTREASGGGAAASYSSTSTMPPRHVR